MKLDYKKADWENFKHELEKTPSTENVTDINLLCEIITNWITQSLEKTILKMGVKYFKSALPSAPGGVGKAKNIIFASSTASSKLVVIFKRSSLIFLKNIFSKPGS